MEEYKAVQADMQHKKKKNGLIAAIIIVIILAIAAVGGTWYYMNNKAKKDKKTQDEQIQQLQKQIDDLKKQAAVASETADWLTYNDTYDKISFKYPKDWKLTEVDISDQLKNQNPNAKVPFKLVKVKSPGGFEIVLDYNVSGIGGGCEGANCPVNTLVDSKKLIGLSNGSQLYLAKYETKNQKNELLSRKIGIIGQKDGVPKIETYTDIPPYFVFQSPGRDNLVYFAGPSSLFSQQSPANIDYKPNLTAEQYFAQPDLQTSAKIFSSIMEIK